MDAGVLKVSVFPRERTALQGFCGTGRTRRQWVQKNEAPGTGVHRDTSWGQTWEGTDGGGGSERQPCLGTQTRGGTLVGRDSVSQRNRGSGGVMGAGSGAAWPGPCPLRWLPVPGCPSWLLSPSLCPRHRGGHSSRAPEAPGWLRSMTRADAQGAGVPADGGGGHLASPAPCRGSHVPLDTPRLCCPAGQGNAALPGILLSKLG